MKYKESIIGWAKAILIVSVLFGLFSASAFAADSVGISDLDSHGLSAFEQGIKAFAKWGGILMIIVTFIMIGSGYAQGQVAGKLLWAGLAVGGLFAAFGWFGNSFTYGFQF